MKYQCYTDAIVTQPHVSRPVYYYHYLCSIEGKSRASLNFSFCRGKSRALFRVGEYERLSENMEGTTLAGRTNLVLGSKITSFQFLCSDSDFGQHPKVVNLEA